MAAGAGWRGVLLLLVFLVGSSLLTPGGGRRRPVQVLANGGVAAACALAARWQPAFVTAFAGAIAAAAADTWSTEIGGRSARAPRLVTTWRPVERGTSGGVTLLGTAGGALGALSIGGASAALGLVPLGLAGWIAAAGLLAALADSLLGATLQVRFRCAVCSAVTEDARHDCGGPLERHSGLSVMTNDAVNFLATLTGAALAFAPLAGAAGLPGYPQAP